MSPKKQACKKLILADRQELCFGSTVMRIQLFSPVKNPDQSVEDISRLMGHLHLFDGVRASSTQLENAGERG